MRHGFREGGGCKRLTMTRSEGSENNAEYYLFCIKEHVRMRARVAGRARGSRAWRPVAAFRPSRPRSSPACFEGHVNESKNRGQRYTGVINNEVTSENIARWKKIRSTCGRTGASVRDTCRVCMHSKASKSEADIGKWKDNVHGSLQLHIV